MIKVGYIYRADGCGISVERMFEDVRKAMPEHIEQMDCIAPYSTTNNVFKIFANLIHVRRHNYDINHVTGDVNYVCGLLDKKKTIVTVLDLHYLDRSDKTAVKRFVYRIMNVYIPAWRSAHLVFISEDTKRHFLSFVKLPDSRCHVIPPCISEWFSFSPKECLQKSPVLLQIGTAYNKNLSRMIVAIAPLGCRLRIVGAVDDEIQALLKLHAIDYTSVQSIDDEQLLREYQNCDIVMFPSLSEGFGMPIIEAQAVGRPVVTSDRSPMHEVAGGGAVLVDPESVNSIRAGVQSVMNDRELRERNITVGLENAKKYTPGAVAEAYADLYRKISQ